MIGAKLGLCIFKNRPAVRKSGLEASAVPGEYMTSYFTEPKKRWAAALTRGDVRIKVNQPW